MTSPAEETVHLYLSDMHNMFQTPEVDPFLGENIEASGIDQLIDTMNARHGGQKPVSAIAIHLPEAQITPELPTRMSTAITNYCNAQIRLAAQKKRETWLEGRKALRIGLVFWAICLALSLLFEEVIFTRHAMGRLFGEGFIIAGWVGLWRPAELLLYDWRPYSREIRRYEEIQRMKVVLVPREAGGTQLAIPI
ncbi:hypothetical protein K32_19370 [Kaistia sp. 32K]|uniref:hypothetical protein n=1 Tax=Kaistia sp. 32K TaxID=2795690 RepID=UPI00191586A0|nr:hypothetical protein [Kaistia sp. 32K]BCP53320.1 hypothetical protein K32_19370 [Kaistia sp. 32K]